VRGETVSQRNVETLIGRLVTDEAFRRRFAEDPGEALRKITECGVELTDLELRALASIDARSAEQFAEAVDPRIQKIDIHGGRP
jgi:putative modified peptide